MADVSRDAELGFMKRILSRAESDARRARWRLEMRRRSTRISRALHFVKLAAGGPVVTLVKANGGSDVLVHGSMVATVVIATPGRTIEDLRAPLRVVLHRRDALREDVLGRLVTDGSIVIDRG